MNILLIDDEKVLCELLSCYLVDFGHTVTMANSIEEAVSMIEEQDFNIIIADMSLPDGNGLDLIKTAHKRDSKSHKIVMSGYRLSDTDKKKMKHVPFQFLNKPFGLSDINHILTTIYSN
ncbi:response regulator [bacterium]|nr:response regulator [bacterium]